MNEITVDLYSDTITQPSKAMRDFMAGAKVGDEQEGADPTVNLLIDMVCELLGKEAALYLPSGTMCNQISFRVYCQPGDEIIMDETGHSRHYETGGPAALSGAMIYPIRGQKGVFSGRQFESAIRPKSTRLPRSRVVFVEQTSNLGGGTIWPLENLHEISALAKSHGIFRHMDGARLFNASVASGIPPKEYASTVDSVWVDFSKGLGAPVGAVLAGSSSFIADAWRWKQQFGGAMRQAGIIAAGAVFALEHHMEKLHIDHANAKLLTNGLNAIGGIQVEEPETNMVFFDVSSLDLTSENFCALLATRGIRLRPVSSTRVRAVTHLDISPTQIQEALVAIRETTSELAN